MAKNNNHAETKEVAPATSQDLNRLRDILYGGFAKESQERFQSLEMRLDSVRQALQRELESTSNNLSQNSSTALQNVEASLLALSEKNAAQEAQALADAQQMLLDKLDDQAQSHSQKVNSMNRDLTNVINEMNSNLSAQIEAEKDYLSDRLDKMAQQHADQFAALQAESKKRDKELQETLDAVTQNLENDKVSYDHLAELFSGFSLAVGSGSGDEGGKEGGKKAKK